MHLLNAARLADELRRNELSEKQKLGYLMALCLMGMMFGRPTVMGSFGTRTGAAAALVLLVFTFGGILHCFRVNERGDGRSFIERFWCLSLPLTLWWVIATWSVAIGANLVTRAIGVPDAEFTRGYNAWAPSAAAAITPAFYLAMARYVGRAAGMGNVGDRR